MPKSGSSPVDRQRGFTLLEVMVVLLIMGVALGAASVSAFGDAAQRTQRQDAQRLAGLFMVAQTEARAGGSRIVWRPGGQGFDFQALPRPLMLPTRVAARSSLMRDAGFGPDSPLRPRAWLSPAPVSVQIRPAGVLTFGGDWVAGPVEITLSAGNHSVRVARSAAGQYQVQP